MECQIIKFKHRRHNLWILFWNRVKVDKVGAGTGKAVLYTPGLSMEVLGEGLKVRDNGDITQLTSKNYKM